MRSDAAVSYHVSAAHMKGGYLMKTVINREVLFAAHAGGYLTSTVPPDIILCAPFPNGFSLGYICKLYFLKSSWQWSPLQK